MEKIPYQFRCAACGVGCQADRHRRPEPGDDCAAQSGGHLWRRCVGPARVAAHEAGHAVAAAILLGPGCLTRVTMEHPRTAETVYDAGRADPSVLIVGLAGIAVTAKIGDRAEARGRQTRETPCGRPMRSWPAALR